MRNQSYLNHIIRKRFNQHFLIDSYIIDYIVSTINPQPKQAIIEIGPGLGALTKPISSITSLTVIELDRDLASKLINNPQIQHKINVIQQNAMTINFKNLSTQLGQPLRIFGNLPYNISTPLMFHIFKYTKFIHDMYFMLQKEVVDRLLAVPNSKTYGRLSILAQYHCAINHVLNVPASAFLPAPKVESAIIELLPYKNKKYPTVDLNKLSITINHAFNQRRKTIRNSLANLFKVEQIIDQKIDTTLRAENLSIEQYCKLANLVRIK